ncbi:MAG: hypothetical protein OHK0029_38830 [Armatimonadaceae bacterium]
MATEAKDADTRAMELFEGAGPIDTPTPGVRAWLARDAVGEHRPVLIKRVKAERKERATEALLLMHPNIVRTRRWLLEEGNLYVVRDVVKGKNLRQTLASLGGTRPTPELLRKMMAPVLDALNYTHGLGVAHGGISADNILIANDGGIWISDFATTDPTAPQHRSAYKGEVTVQGDITALGRVISAYLPTTGAFASPSVRGRIEGVLSRCDTLEDLRVTLNALERLAAPPTRSPENPQNAAPRIRGEEPPTKPEPPRPDPPLRPGPPPLEMPGTAQKAEAAPPSPPALLLSIAERSIRVPQGGGGFATILARNEAKAPLVVRMVATQYPWLNLREPSLPLTISPNGIERIGFNISAARLTPGEYRSEVYVLANGTAPGAEAAGSGWYKHTIEILITVEAPVRPSRFFG